VPVYKTIHTVRTSKNYQKRTQFCFPVAVNDSNFQIISKILLFISVTKRYKLSFFTGLLKLHE
jgi:hypothetical protein